MYGVLLPGPNIGRALRCGRCAASPQGGFEVGVHTWDHVRWQDGVASASEPWTRRELTRARDQFAEVFGHFPLVHGAAGWQMNEYVPQLQQELGFRLRLRHARQRALPAAAGARRGARAAAAHDTADAR